MKLWRIKSRLNFVGSDFFSGQTNNRFWNGSRCSWLAFSTSDSRTHSFGYAGQSLCHGDEDGHDWNDGVLGRSSAIQLEMIFFPLPLLLLVFPPCFGWNKFPSILGRLEALFLLFFRLTGVGVWFSTIFLSFGSLKWKINILFSCAWRIFRCLLWRRPRVAGFVWMESERSMC